MNKPWLLCTMLLLLSQSHLIAKPLVDPCQKLTVAVDEHWPPHVISQTNGQHTGIAIQLIKKLAKELNIPITFVPIKTYDRTLQQLKAGDTDLLASLYPNQRYQDAVELISPGYLADGIKVAIRKEYGTHADQWQQLAGLQGGCLDSFQGDDHFTHHILPRLQLSYFDKTADLIAALEQKNLDYLLGSEAQLDYLMKKNHLEHLLDMVPQLEHPRVVYLGMSAKSPCYAYMPFFRKRMAELVEGYVPMDWQRQYQQQAELSEAIDPVGDGLPKPPFETLT